VSSAVIKEMSATTDDLCDATLDQDSGVASLRSVIPASSGDIAKDVRSL